MNAQLQPQPYTDFRLVIGGKLVEGASTFDVINPATEQVLARCPRADKAQLNQAVAAAKAAFPAWAATPIAERRRLLLALADALAARVDEFARLLTQEQGKPLPMAQGEIFGAVATIKGFAGMDLPDKVLEIQGRRYKVVNGADAYLLLDREDFDELVADRRHIKGRVVPQD